MPATVQDFWIRARVFQAVALVFATSCARSGGGGTLPPDSVARPATGAPSRFLYDATLFSPDSLNNEACRTPMVHPDDGTRLVLVRWDDTKKGDYEVPEGRYGVGKNELLRINCITGGVIGIVPR